MIRRYSMSDQMDEWLESQGFYRKHTAKDGSCLFRAVSEQIFNTQAHHVDVRLTCVKYMKRNRDKFEEFIEGSFDDYLSNMNNPKEWGGQVEMNSMSLVFKRDFIIFQEVGKPPFAATDNGYTNTVVLYFSQSNHYDSVYPKGFIANAAFCQSIVYDMLYKGVFKMGDDVDFAVEKMLHDKTYAKLRKDSVNSLDSTCALVDFVLEQPSDATKEDWNEKDLGSDIRRTLAQGFPPFPYKVAKALDPDIYRNVEFDVWNETRKEEMTFEPGVKCLVRMDKEKPDSYHAHIQEVTPNKGPVTVYIVELGQKQTVSYDSLEPLPYKGWQTQTRIYKSMSTSYYQKSLMNGTNTVEFDKYKGRKKFFRKGKFKEIAMFPIRVPRSHQSIVPHQSQFDSSFLPLGRGRGGAAGGGGQAAMPFHPMRNSSQHIKWISPSTRSPRYNNYRSGNGCNDAQYFISNDYNRAAFDKAVDYGQHLQAQQNEAQNFAASGLGQTSVTLTKTFVGQISNDSSSSAAAAGLQRPATSLDNKDLPPSSAMPVSSQPGSISTGGQPQGPEGPSAPSPPPPPSSSSQSIQFPNANNATSYDTGCGNSPQPVTIFSCPYFTTGLCVPYDPLLQQINYMVPKSQDLSGNDLPFQDLATLRFFFNLGCDYFRMTSGGPQMPPHVVWNYGSTPGPQMAYATGPQATTSSINGYLTPLSSSEGAEDSSGGHNTPCLSEGDTGQSQSTPVEEMYETAYIYSTSPVGFVPGLWTHPIDYGMHTPPPPLPGMVGAATMADYKSGLIMNDQGVLSLGPQFKPTTNTTAISLQQNQVRQRSDSVSSCRSQRVNGDWNNAGYANVAASAGSRHTHHARNGGREFECSGGDQRASYNKGPQQQQHHQQQQQSHFSQRDIASQHKKQQQQHHQQQSSQGYSFVGQPLLAYAMSSNGQQGSAASIPQSGSSSPFNFLSASPTSLGINYSTGSPVGPLFSAQPAYFSPPHPSTATLVYSPPTHPIPYYPSSSSSTAH